MHKLKAGAKKTALCLRRLLRRHWKSVLYYGCVALVLSAVAYAAEVYRMDNSVDEMILPAAELEVKQESKMPVLNIPGGMEIIRGYSKEAVWNENLALWESHEAVDFRIAGNEVPALADGKVTAIGSGKNGNYIELAQDGLILRYMSVSAAENLQSNDSVKAGEIIGTADESLMREAYMGPHLHLEAIYNEELANAESFVLRADAAPTDS